MTAVGVIGILICLAAFPFAKWNTKGSVAIFAGLLGAHVAASYVYYRYSLSNPSDSNLYFNPPPFILLVGFTSGTQAVILFVDNLKKTLGGTLLDHFLIFQAFGFWGIILMMRTFEELRAMIGVRQSPWAWVILALPSLHFWTSAIGKDAPIFLAASLAMWSVLRLRSRIFAFCLAIALMMLVRPHIALVAVASVALSVALGKRLEGLSKAALVVLALGGIALTATSVEQSYGVSVSDPDSLGRFFEQQQGKAQEISGGTTVNAIFPVRLFSLFFRPFFIDANGFMGVIASAENILAFALFFYLLRYAAQIVRLARSEFFVGYALLFSVVTLLLLALVYYNVGLGLRQRVMAYPTLFTMFLTHALLVKARRDMKREAAREELPEPLPVGLR